MQPESLSISPDGKKVAISSIRGHAAGIWVYDLARDSMTRLTFGAGIYDTPVWSPDGRYVVFSGYSVGIMYARADGGGRPQTLVESKRELFLPAAFTPDGKV